MIGELAALFTSLCFSFTSTFFTLAGRRVGSMVVNRSRLLVALLLLISAHWLLYGTPVPLQAGGERWFWLGLSGVIGLTLGDAFLFQAFVWIGPRLSMLMMSLAPVLAAITAWLFLDETLNAGQIAGVLLTLTGVAWVIFERRGNPLPAQEHPHYLRGVLFALGGATGQALGLVTAKFGLAGDFSPLSGTLMRMMVAAVALWAFTLARRQGTQTVLSLARSPRAALLILAGAFSGPFLGVTSSLLAIQRAPVGIASTLMALPPVFLLPVGYLVFKERFGWQAVAGTVVAIAGVALLFMV